MKPSIAAAALFALMGCVPSQDTEGQIVAANGKTVTIRGMGDYSPATIGKGFKPTPAMDAQAQSVCAGAKFASAVPESPDSWAINYLYLCP